MSPQKQAAQLANAQKSHGPVTEAGRARSSQNSIRHSLCSKKYFIVPEDRPEFDIYYNDLIGTLAPEGALEAKLAEAIIMDEWRLTRARQVENQIFFRGYMSTKPDDEFISGAETWLAHSKELATLTLYEQRINRVLARNKAEFSSLQSTRRGAGLPACALSTTENASPEAHEILTQPLESNPETATAEPAVGFVRSSATASTPETLPQKLAATRPVGFVRSNAPVAAAEAPVDPPAERIADPQPASTPPAVSRRAA